MICICMPMAHAVLYAQVMDHRMMVDTLSAAERISVRTNMADWLLLTPNIGVEYDLRGTNWNRWAVGLNVRGNWQTKHTYKPAMVYNIAEARVELKQYYRLRTTDSRLEQHTSFIDKVFSARRKHVKHPSTTYYKGAYAAMTNFSVKTGSEGRQGSALSAGLLLGMVKPLYVFANGNSLDLEMAVAAGLAYARYDKFRHDRESDCYPVTQKKDWHIVPHPVLSELRVGFAYRFGKYPVTKKYRWRYDCDQTYRNIVDSISLVKETDRKNRHTEDSLRTIMEREFKAVYDSAAAANKRIAEKQMAEQAKLKAGQDKLKAEQNKLKKEQTEQENTESTALGNDVNAAQDKNEKAGKKAKKKEKKKKKNKHNQPEKDESRPGADADNAAKRDKENENKPTEKEAEDEN